MARRERPALLFLDIETQPDLVYTWGVYQANAISVKKHWQLLSYSAKWQGGSRITRSLPDIAGYKVGGGDYDLACEIWALLDRADIVVAHNGVDFDFKKLNARFISHGLHPPAPYRVVDTKRAVKQVAGFSSNKLDWLAQQLELGRKLEHEGWALWEGCMAGVPKAWHKMKRYNAHDVVLLEKLYNRIAPWIRQPAMNIGLQCTNPSCGSTNLERRGTARTKTRSYQRYQCRACGAWMRDVASLPQRAGVVGF